MLSGRQDSLACTLEALGLLDTFRARHPEVRGFTYYAASGGASRIDGIWVRMLAGALVDILNACVVWRWPKRSDHEPAMFDALLQLHVAEAKPHAPPTFHWREIIGKMLGQGREELGDYRYVAASVRVRQAELHSLEVELSWERQHHCVFGGGVGPEMGRN